MLRQRLAHRKCLRDSSWDPHPWRGGEKSQDELEEESEVQRCSGDSLSQTHGALQS